MEEQLQDITIGKIVIASSWNEISIRAYKELEKATNDYEVLKAISNVEAYKDIKFMELVELKKDLEFLNTPPKEIKFRSREIEIDKKKYTLVISPKQLTASQYIDLQSYINSPSENMSRILAVCIVPKGSKYNDGSYDIDELIELIETKVSIEFATGFFLHYQKVYNKLEKILLSYSEKVKKKIEMKTKKTKKNQ